jgi:hypothetical protein
MKSTSCCAPGTVAAGERLHILGFQWIFATSWLMGHSHGVFVLGSQGERHRHRKKYRNGGGYPDTFAFHL